MDLRQLRNLTRLSQVELARKSGINRVRLSLAENGELLLRSAEQEILLDILRQEVARFSRELQDVTSGIRPNAKPASGKPGSESDSGRLAAECGMVSR